MEREQGKTIKKNNLQFPRNYLESSLRKSVGDALSFPACKAAHVPPLPRGASTLCLNLCSRHRRSLSARSLRPHATSPTRKLLPAFARSGAGPLRLPEAASPTSCPRCLPPPDGLPGEMCFQPAGGWMGAGAGRQPATSSQGRHPERRVAFPHGQAFPSQGFIQPDQGGWPVSPRAKAAVPRAARKLDSKIPAVVSPPWCTPAWRRKRLFSSPWWPCRGPRAGWEPV